MTDINLRDTCQNSEKLYSDKNTLIIWVHTFFDSCVNESRNAVEDVNINPYYCPAMGQKIKYFSLYSGVMISKFGFGKVNASSSAVEFELNIGIKNGLVPICLITYSVISATRDL